MSVSSSKISTTGLPRIDDDPRLACAMSCRSSCRNPICDKRGRPWCVNRSDAKQGSHDPYQPQRRAKSSFELQICALRPRPWRLWHWRQAPAATARRRRPHAARVLPHLWVPPSHAPRQAQHWPAQVHHKAKPKPNLHGPWHPLPLSAGSERTNPAELRLSTAHPLFCLLWCTDTGR